jgi:hypothetical protein
LANTSGDIVVVVERSSPLVGPVGLVRARDEELKNPPLSRVAMLVNAALRTAQDARERKAEEGKVCVLEVAEEKPGLTWIEQEQAKVQVKALLSAEGFRIEECDTSFHKNVNQPAGAFMQVALKRVRREELWACWGEKV